jgi:hypothetical protein
MRRAIKYPLVLIALVAVLVGARLALPYFVLDHVNDRLVALKGYDGHVDDIDIALWRGAYRIDAITIVREQGGDTPFFTADHIDLSIEWRSLFKGSIVGTALFEQPVLNLVQAENAERTQLGKGVNWFARLEEFFPFRFNTVEARNGSVTFRAPGIATQDALTAQNVNAEVRNLTNVSDSTLEAFADFDVHGEILGQAPAHIAGRVDPGADHPTFDVNMTLEKVELVQLNPWLRAYAKVDAEGGSFQLYSEIAAEDGAFKGYVKPLMQDVNIYSSKEEESNPFRRLWEGLVEVVAELFENQSEDQVASLVPLSGRLDDPDVDVFESIVGVLRNAFVGAFSQSLENTISLAAIGGGEEAVVDKEADAEAKTRKPPPERRIHGPSFGPRSFF